MAGSPLLSTRLVASLPASDCIGCPSGGSGGGHTVGLVLAVVLVMVGLGLATVGPGRADRRFRVGGFALSLVGLIVLFAQA